MNASLPATRFEPHRRRLTGLARGWLGSHAEAQGAVQDAWLRVQAGVPRALDSDAAWLVTVLRHVCIDRLRRRQLESREAALAAAPESEPSAEARAALAIETRTALRRMTALLSAADLAALLLHAVFEFEHGEIARLAGQPVATVRQRVHRALRRVRSRLADGRVDDDADTASASAAQEAMFSLCWRALHQRDAAGLIAQVESAPRLRTTSSRARASSRGESTEATPRSRSRVLQVDGVFALAWILDGVVLCTVPMGPVGLLASDREDVAIA